MEYTRRLRAEIARLRDLLEENGIDPEPYVAPPPQFGPPTLMEHVTNKAVAGLMKKVARDISIENWIATEKKFGPLRIRLPTDFSIRS